MCHFFFKVFFGKFKSGTKIKIIFKYINFLIEYIWGFEYLEFEYQTSILTVSIYDSESNLINSNGQSHKREPHHTNIKNH